MRHWWVVGLAVLLCGRAEAGSVDAKLRVSAVVVDQCIVRTASRSASCSGQSTYVLDVAQEAASIAARQPLIMLGEHEHSATHGPFIGSVRSASSGQVASESAVVPLGDEIRVTRVTYSF